MHVYQHECEGNVANNLLKKECLEISVQSEVSDLVSERTLLYTCLISYSMLSLILLLPHLLAVLSPTGGVVYYVKPTEPCDHTSSCPSNETCHTMDHYARNSSHYFSPDHVDVTLFFMCGVHNLSASSK